MPTVLSTTIYLARKEGTEQTFLPKRKRSFILKENGKTSRPAKQKSTVFKPVKECLYEIGPHLIQGITRLKNVRPKPRGIYRTRAKISRAYSKLTRFLDALIFEHFRKMLIFEPCLFKIYNNFEALFFKIYLIFWPISMYSRYVYGSNIPLEYTVMLWYLQLYLRNKFYIFSKF